MNTDVLKPADRKSGFQASYVFSRPRILQSKVFLQPGLLDTMEWPTLLSEAQCHSKHFIITDTIINEVHGRRLLSRLTEKRLIAKTIVIPPGEASKSLTIYQRIITEILSWEPDHDSVIFGLGGGVVNNLSGFVASTLYRGLSLIQIPTTLMAQLDAAIDFKHAINLDCGKNLLGSYYPASNIVVDPLLLNTLPERDLRSGLAEALKHALVQDSTLLDKLLTYSGSLQDQQFLQHILQATIMLKVSLLTDPVGDYPEMVQQYGHAIGHALEHLSGYQLLHGEAIAIGMCVTAELSRLLCIGSEALLKLHHDLLQKYRLPTIIPPTITANQILQALTYDKHRVGHNIQLALASDKGELFQAHGSYAFAPNPELLLKAINLNKERAI